MQKKNIKIYETPKGKKPFAQWFSKFKDSRTKARIRQRINRLEEGNYGDYKPVGDGVCELRLFFGSGYRIYFAEVDNTIVLLLCAGDKGSQNKDIEKAKDYWREFKDE